MLGWFGKKPVAKRRTGAADHGHNEHGKSGANREQQAAQISGNNGGPRIEGHVDPEILDRAAGAVKGKHASESIKGLMNDDDGRKAMANTLRKWMNDGRS
jgi:hypothetical protein